MTESPFVRSGAVVRCSDCRQKFRIKSSHFERVLHTGPRTIDEADAVLRSDSVDIDPDEVSPVSIDDDGNVVGLSGLSELMRWSDDQPTQHGAAPSTRRPGQDPHDKLKARLADESRDALSPLPKAKTRASAAAPQGAEHADAKRRARQAARKRKKNTQVLILVALACVLLGLTVVILLLKGFLGGASDPVATDPGVPDAGLADNGPEPLSPGGLALPAQRGDPAAQTPGPIVADPDPDEILFVLPDKPVPNPDPKFVAPWAVQAAPDALPADAPTRYAPAQPVSFEGWYILNPPRGADGGSRSADVRLDGPFEARPAGDGTLLLTSTAMNRAGQPLLRGELHVVLLDGSESVFAEGFVPLLMLADGGGQPVSIPIAERYWNRARQVRVSASVSAWAQTLSPLEGVEVSPIGEGLRSALRVSCRHRGDTPLDSFVMLVEAMDAAGRPLARFFLEERGLALEGGQWLDLVVGAPLDEAFKATSWSVRVYPGGAGADAEEAQ